MDVVLLIRNRLNQLKLDQKDLASAVQVTESYVSQLLSRKKPPPAPGRTDLYDRIGEFLGLSKNELAKLADLQRKEDLRKTVVETPGPLYKEFRDLILRKCASQKRNEVRMIFGKQPFGELERLITQVLLDVTQGVAREELRSEVWLRRMARMSDRTYEQIRVAMLEFLDTDVFDVSVDNCVSFLDPMVESWDIDLGTFAFEIVLNSRLAPGRIKRFEFVEREPEDRRAMEPGLEQFLKDPSLSRDITEEEIDFLKRLRFDGRRPSSLYYYREFQSLRDPLHFPAPSPSKARSGDLGI